MWMASVFRGVEEDDSNVINEQSTFLSGHAGGSRASGSAVPNGMLRGRRVGGGTSC
jgi:hypothetical protein